MTFAGLWCALLLLSSSSWWGGETTFVQASQQRHRGLREEEQPEDTTDTSTTSNTTGIESEDSTGRIAGGVLAQAGEAPWFVVLKLQDPDGNVRTCGGSLIHSDIVVTSGGCTLDHVDETVRIDSLQASTDGIERTIAHAVQHPDYEFRMGHVQHDIGVWQLNTTVLDIEVLVLNEDHAVPAADATLQIFGHGQESMFGSSPGQLGQTAYAEELRTVQVPVTNQQSNPFCGIVTGGTGAGGADPFGGNDDNDDAAVTLCVGNLGDGRGPCFGDVGGPVVWQQQQQQPADDTSTSSSSTLVALVGFGLGCGVVPSVTTRISPYVPWLRDQICQLSQQPPPSCGATLQSESDNEDNNNNNNNDNNTPPSPVSCFPHDATVVVRRGRQQSIPLSQVQRGDWVLVDNNNNKYEPVYTFGHRLANVQVHDFVQLRTATTTTLTLSPHHLVFVRDNNKDNNNNHETASSSPRAIPAAHVRAGQHQIYTTTTTPGWTTVTSVSSHVTGQGLYAPFTPSGRIVVNGVQTSVYAALSDVPLFASHYHHSWYHLWLAPIRRYFEFVVGVSQQQEEQYNDEGVSSLLQPLWHGYNWWRQQLLVVRVPVGVAFVVVATLVGVLVETTMVGITTATNNNSHHTWLLMAMLAMMMMSIVMRSRRHTTTKKTTTKKMVSSSNKWVDQV